MMISDLNCLEVLAEESSVVVGGSSKYKPEVDVEAKSKPNLNLELKIEGTSVGVINQVAIPTSVAVALNGKAYAKVESENTGSFD